MALATLSDALPPVAGARAGSPSVEPDLSVEAGPTVEPGPSVVPDLSVEPGPSVVPGLSVEPGLSARMSSLSAALGAVVADLDPGLLLGADAASLYGDFARLERLVVAGKTLLAPRIADSGHWETEGHRSPAGLLATLEGGSSGQAKRLLETGRRLSGLPGTEDALRRGVLSGPKLAEIAEAAEADPEAESSLLAGSSEVPLQVIKERCQRVRATSATKDPLATLSRIHARRSFASWTDSEGAFCFQGRDTPERGAALLARLVPVANRLRSDRRAAAADADRSRPKGAPTPPPEPEVALRADALFLLLTRRPPGPPGTPPTASTGPAASAGHVSGPTDPDPIDPRTVDPTDPCIVDPRAVDPDDVGGADDLITAVPPATVMVRVDLEALRRGRALPGELCELDGQGPVPIHVAQSLMDDAFLALVFTEAGDIRSVAHRGRTINRHLRTALVFRDRCCVVPGCRVAYGLEIDHVRPLESGGDTRLDNLALLCRHHHRMKTYDGWTLERTGPTDEDPRWCFTPLPPFGQEPELGLDRPPEPVPRN